ncbi:DNA-directed RNA polymerase subunit L [Candidatus Woesearchaeota archaeon]|jgi:DNA-directed RNA polymerase subunit L|nr:DNA-directed RNA polymerase subunit L [Candidatus Woesearchaeota archaeon]MDP6648449.1 DNA-directed RNA polymerase subunit L [Candidatus Woesearchaeota archaeon]|tara:strand:- start:42668 stop:42946 length:279 start_codon:yes stop_codon:yes gene_type:complete
MEIKILDDKKNKLMLEVKDVDHTLCNALKTELWNDKHVKIATYSIRHPQISVPQIIVETDGEETPKNALIGAVQRLHKTNEKFKKEFSKEIK